MDDFEKQIHSMFDHIWDCNIDHPVFEDTVGDLMEAVIQCYRNLISTQPEIIKCEDCKYGDPNRKYGCTVYHYRRYETHEMKPDDSCSRAKRRTDG